MSQLALAGLAILWLGVRRANHSAIAACLCKILNGKVKVPADSVDLVLNQRPTRGTSANQQILIIQRVRTVEFKNLFSWPPLA